MTFLFYRDISRGFWWEILIFVLWRNTSGDFWWEWFFPGIYGGICLILEKCCRDFWWGMIILCSNELSPGGSGGSDLFLFCGEIPPGNFGGNDFCPGDCVFYCRKNTGFFLLWSIYLMNWLTTNYKSLDQKIKGI